MSLFLRPNTLLEVVRRYNSGEQDIEFAHADFLFEFYAHPESRGQMLENEPALIVSRDPETSSDRMNANIGAIAEYLATHWGLPIPAWTEKPERFLKTPWNKGYKYGPEIAAHFYVASPAAYSRRGIYTEEEPMRRANMPSFTDLPRHNHPSAIPA